LNKYIKYFFLSLILAGISYFFIIRIHKSNKKDKSEITNFLTFSHKQGFYRKPFELTISSISPTDTVYYTLDGSVPTKNSFIYKFSVKIDYRYNDPNIISNIPTTPDNYTGIQKWHPPLGKIFKATIVRAASVRNKNLSSKVYTLIFFVDTNIYSRYSMPIVSLITDADNFFSYDKGIYVTCKYYDKTNPNYTGNYSQRGSNWERPVNIAFLKKNGAVTFSQDAGIRIHGTSSRKHTQKRLRLYARKKYGNQYFNYKIFPQKNKNKFKRLILANFPTFKDVLIYSIIKDLNIDMPDYRPVIVFINGEYWGIHVIRDQLDKYYLASKYNIDKNNIVILGGNSLIKQETDKQYNNLIKFVENNNLKIPKNYQYVKNQIDIDCYIDHQIVRIYTNYYGTHNNKLWRPKTQNGKWRWFLYDMDKVFSNSNNNLLKQLVSEKDIDPAILLFRNLLKNKEFKNQFIDRFIFLMNTTFQKDTVLNKINELEKLYEPEIKEHFDRWYNNIDAKEFIGLSKTNIDTVNSVDDILFYYISQLKDFAGKRPYYMKKFIMEEFNLNKFDYNNK